MAKFGPKGISFAEISFRSLSQLCYHMCTDSRERLGMEKRPHRKTNASRRQYVILIRTHVSVSLFLIRVAKNQQFKARMHEVQKSLSTCGIMHVVLLPPPRAAHGSNL